MSLITFLTRVHFADGVLEDALPEALLRVSSTRPLLLTDGDAVMPRILERVHDALPPQCTHADFPQLDDATASGRLAAASDLIKLGGCDSIVCIGGKTVMDFGRLLAARQDRASRPAIITVPTSVASVGLGPVHMPGLQVELSQWRQPALPAAILCDPTMTLGTPKETLAAHGFKALVNCVEAFLATAYNPPADGIALEGMRRSALYLERAVQGDNDLDAHRELLAVALNAGLAAQKGFGGAEALARATQDEGLGAGSHGWFYPAVVPPVLAFNAPAVGGRYELISKAMALPGTIAVADGLSAMGRRLGLPERLASLELNDDQVESVARRAAADPANLTNPRHATHKDYRDLLRQAM
ncbi:MAG: iron-containing alcohol dehydrogenase [Devosiaceae bacterium]|nr:iron-containing alcohol dehydrogenase [Devosiaceae bacterium MH13]